MGADAGSSADVRINETPHTRAGFCDSESEGCCRDRGKSLRTRRCGITKLENASSQTTIASTQHHSPAVDSNGARVGVRRREGECTSACLRDRRTGGGTYLNRRRKCHIVRAHTKRRSDTIINL